MSKYGKSNEQLIFENKVFLIQREIFNTIGQLIGRCRNGLIRVNTYRSGGSIEMSK